MPSELNRIKELRAAKQEANYKLYNKTLREEGWAVNPKGEFTAVNTSELGRGDTYYVAKANLKRGNLSKQRNRTTTYDEKEALSEINNLHLTPNADSLAAPAARRNSRRATRRRRASRKHRRTYRK